MPAGKAPFPSASRWEQQPTELVLPTYGPCSLWQHLWKMIQTLGRAARVSVALKRLRIVCVHFYIYTTMDLGQGRGSLRCLCARHSWAQPVRSCPSFSETVFTWLSPWRSVSTRATVLSGLRMSDVAEDRWVWKNMEELDWTETKNRGNPLISRRWWHL